MYAKVFSCRPFLADWIDEARQGLRPHLTPMDGLQSTRGRKHLPKEEDIFSPNEKEEMAANTDRNTNRFAPG